MRVLSAAMVLLLLAGAGCGSDGEGADEGMTVVATTTVLGDVVSNIVAPEAEVVVLLPVGVDPHDYQLSARQAAAVQSADLVVAVGLGLEEGMADVLAAAVEDGVPVLEVGGAVDPIAFEGGGVDPHIWHDPVRMAEAAAAIANRLADVDDSVDWRSRADDYAAELLTADEEIRRIVSAVAEDDRELVTNHDSLGYFASRYGFEVVGAVIGGGATLAEPSSAELAELVAEIERRGVRAIFAETMESASLAEAIAAEVGFEVAVVELYTGSLGPPGSGAESLIDMLIVNAQRIAGALS